MKKEVREEEKEGEREGKDREGNSEQQELRRGYH